MTNQEKAKAILKEIDNVYTVPTYMEERVESAIFRALKEIDKAEGDDK